MNEYQTFQSGPRKGQPKTEADRVVKFLVEFLKFREIPSKSRKYRCFKSSQFPSLYWVGKNGAVRGGKNITDSYSLKDTIHKDMKRWEEVNQK